MKSGLICRSLPQLNYQPTAQVNTTTTYKGRPRENSDASFAETFYGIALTNPQDTHFQLVQQFHVLLVSGNVFTTKEVLIELLTVFASDNWQRARAIQTVQAILSDESVRGIAQSHHSLTAGFHLYANRPDKGYSLTDCISMQLMSQQSISKVLTNDKHFEQESFNVLLTTDPRLH